MDLRLSFLFFFLEYAEVWFFLILYNLHMDVGASLIETKGCVGIFNTHQRRWPAGIELRYRNDLKYSFRADETDLVLLPPVVCN